MAAYLAKPEMFFHIANLEREVYWQIGNVTCSAYPIEQLDSINSETGELNTVSALNLIVFGVRSNSLPCLIRYVPYRCCRMQNTCCSCGTFSQKLFHQKTHVCCDTMFVKKFQMNQRGYIRHREYMAKQKMFENIDTRFKQMQTYFTYAILKN